MTGFGRGEVENDNYLLTVELKSVNNRYKDIRFKMGSLLSSLELPMRKKVEDTFRRGSFDISVNYKRKADAKKLADLDLERIKQFVSDMKTIAKDCDVEYYFRPTEFLKGDFYLEDESKQEELQNMTMQAFDNAIKSLEESRVDEGKKLVQKLLEHKNSYETHYEVVKGLRHSYQDNVKEKLMTRFEKEFEGKLDDNRFHQEVIYYLEKLDIDEEINRIHVHLNKVASLMKANNSEIGRQLDFLMQELNRETNTIGSKSASGDISEAVVQMKVNLEKIREQALNIE